jgi:hypothetical protein
MNEKLEKETEKKHDLKCRACGALAVWQCTGEFARYGVPLDSFYCDACKSNVKPRPKLMAYNKFPLTWKLI